MALSQVVTKTYGRRARQAECSQAARTFDEVFKNARSPALAKSTSEKWGAASFTRISHVGSPSKRKLSCTFDSSDPFSFDSDEESKSKKPKNEAKKSTDSASDCKTPIIERFNELAGGYTEWENMNRDVENKVRLKESKSKSHERAPANGKAGNQKSHRESESRPAAKEKKHSSRSVVNGSSHRRSTVKNNETVTEKEEPRSDRTLQLQCYDVFEDDDEISFSQPIYKLLQPSPNSIRPKTTDSSSQKTSKLKSADENKLDSNKCEKQAQVFVSRFARLFSSRRHGASKTSLATAADNNGSSSLLGKSPNLLSEIDTHADIPFHEDSFSKGVFTAESIMRKTGRNRAGEIGNGGANLSPELSLSDCEVRLLPIASSDSDCSIRLGHKQSEKQQRSAPKNSLQSSPFKSRLKSSQSTCSDSSSQHETPEMSASQSSSSSSSLLKTASASSRKLLSGSGKVCFFHSSLSFFDVYLFFQHRM